MKSLRPLASAALLGAAALLTSCAPMTPASRVARTPALFDPLPSSQKELILQSRISEGMSQDAVYLAWGRPDSVTRGSEGGKSYEQWRYTSLRPVYHHSIGISAGFGNSYGRRGRYRNYEPGFFYDTGPDYVPVTSAIVRFREGRVVMYESAGR